MFSSKQLFLPLLAAMALFPAHSFASTVLYGITLDDNLLQITVSPSSVSATLIGQLSTVPDGGSSSLGIGELGGDLYVYDQNQQALLQVSPTDASTIATINLGITNTEEGDLAFAPNGTGYLVSTVDAEGDFGSTGAMYSFSTTPLSANLITDNLSAQIDGLAFDSAGDGFALEQGGATLDSITTGGVITEIGGTGINTDCGGFPCYSLGGLAFADGTLYAALTNFSNSTSDFYTIDPTTGAATYIGDIPFDQISGITAAPSVTPPVPEPSTFVVMAGGLLAIVFRRRWSQGS
ncbi:MAG: PEP-CTERM sorting domain-containing protein [Bryobacteraceae bacterium]